MSMRRPPCVVVGAGVAGLACAVRLSAAGMPVRVLEASDGVGGRVRTDLVEGFLCDRGFQVFNTAYPEARRVLDIAALDVRPFESGLLVQLGNGRRARVMLPWRHPGHALSTLLAGVGTPADKVALSLMTARDLAWPASRLRAAPDRTIAEDLRHRGVSEAMVDTLLRPFLSGVLLERDLSTSSRVFHLIWRCFARGTIGVPAAGMGRIPEQLAARLPGGSVWLGARVERVADGAVELSGGERVEARAVVVAADPGSARRLLGVEVPLMRAVTTFYHVAPRSPLDEPIQVIDATGAIADTLVLSDAAPGYSPDGRALISTSVLGVATDEAPVRARLEEIYGGTRGWRHLATYPIAEALPAMPPPYPLRRPVRLGPGLYVCGDHRDTGSLQGALVSGRRAAQAVLSDS
ncbi:NAD(P)/FAD-dependent oxidoreductase [Nonomuraea pusilla]|uniref:NAD(P)/FAD-dependent oxidoreductase n=1 Tax=Nonomuraea pusilla TaxID=46177 RepID=UPI000B8194CA|nr:NAD(P)/FAD-dependent oxidoreductase [Nonomuraea pusilla]